MLAVRSQRHGAEWPSAEKRTAAAPRDPNGAARAHYGRSQLPVVLLGPSPSATEFLFHKLCSSFTSFSCVLFRSPVPPTLPAAPSKAVLVQLTPLLGALVGAAVTLCLVALCIIVFVKFKTKVSKDGSVFWKRLEFSVLLHKHTPTHTPTPTCM